MKMVIRNVIGENATLMKRILIFTILLTCLFLPFQALAAPPRAVDDLVVFPGAEGFGTGTLGAFGAANGVYIYVVNSLADTTGNPTATSRNTYNTNIYQGTLRQCVNHSPAAGYGKLIVFEVGGTINLGYNDPLYIDNDFTTIAGQTAPSPGIALIRSGVRIQDAHDILIQHIRIRPNDIDATAEEDALRIHDVDADSDCYNIIADHMTLAWAKDEIFSQSATGDVTTPHDITLSNSIISEPINIDEGHCYAALLSGQDITFYRNIILSSFTRGPRLEHTGCSAEIINNFVYNSKYLNGFWATAGSVKGAFINNVYENGPSSANDYADWVVTINSWQGNTTNQLYSSGNICDECGGAWDGVKNLSATPDASIKVDAAPVDSGITAAAANTIKAALTATEGGAGARPLDRDNDEVRIINEVLSAGSSGSMKTFEQTQPTLASTSHDFDTAGDYPMPDDPFDDDKGFTHNLDGTITSSAEAGDTYYNIEEWLFAFLDKVEDIPSGSPVQGDLFDTNKGTFPYSTLEGPELVTNGAFTSNVVGWSSFELNPFDSFAGGVSGNCARQTATADSGYSYQENIVVTNGNLYTFGFYAKRHQDGDQGRVYLDADNHNEWDLYLSGWLNDAAWTNYSNSITATSAEMNISLKVAANGETHYYDSISLKQDPISAVSWVAQGTNTIEIDAAVGSGGALHITFVDDINGAKLTIANATDFSGDLVVGKTYTFAGKAKVTVGDSVDIEVYGAASQLGHLSTEITATTLTSFSFTFVAETTNSDDIQFDNGAPGEEIWLDELTLQQEVTGVISSLNTTDTTVNGTYDSTDDIDIVVDMDGIWWRDGYDTLAIPFTHSVLGTTECAHYSGGGGTSTWTFTYEPTDGARFGDLEWGSRFKIGTTLSSWTGPDGNGEYYATYTAQSVVLYWDDDKWAEGTEGTLTATQWDYNAGNNRLYVGADPSGIVVQVSQTKAIIDESGTPISDIGLPAGGSSLGGQRAIVIEDIKDWVVGSGAGADKATLALLITQIDTDTGSTYGLLPDDNVNVNSANGIGAVDLSASAGTIEHPITFDGGGFSHPGTQTFGPYWIIKRVKHGSTVTLGANDTHKYSLIPSGDILKIPEGATGCTIHDDGIRGTLDLDEGTLGAEVITDATNRDFSGAGDWIASGASTITVNYDSGDGGHATTMRVEAGDATLEAADLPASTGYALTADKLYKLTFGYKDVESTNITATDRIRFLGVLDASFDLAVSAGAWTTKILYFTVDTTSSLRLLLYTNREAGHADNETLFDSVSLKETTGVYNTWIATVDPTGLDADESVLFYNCAFVESQAVIEAKDADDDLIFDAECQFSINTAAPTFKDYAGNDFHLTILSILKDAGEDTGPDTDLDGVITPQDGVHDIGPYEFPTQLIGGPFSLGLGLGLN